MALLKFVLSFFELKKNKTFTGLQHKLDYK